MQKMYYSQSRKVCTLPHVLFGNLSFSIPPKQWKISNFSVVNKGASTETLVDNLRHVFLQVDFI